MDSYDHALTSDPLAAGRPSTAATGSPATANGAVETVKEEAAHTAQAAAAAGGQVLGTAAEEARQMAGETARQAKDLLVQTRAELTDQAHAQKERATTGLRALAEELQSIGAGELPKNGVTTDLARQGGDRAHALAAWLDQRDAGQIMAEVRRYARRRPGTFLLGAAVAGIVSGRLTRGMAAGSVTSPAPSTPGTPSGPSAQHARPLLPPSPRSAAPASYGAGATAGLTLPAEDRR